MLHTNTIVSHFFRPLRDEQGIPVFDADASERLEKEGKHLANYFYMARNASELCDAKFDTEEMERIFGGFEEQW